MLLSIHTYLKRHSLHYSGTRDQAYPSYSYLTYCPGGSSPYIMTPTSRLLTHLTHPGFKTSFFHFKIKNLGLHANPNHSFIQLPYTYSHDSFDTTTVKLLTHRDVGYFHHFYILTRPSDAIIASIPFIISMF